MMSLDIAKLREIQKTLDEPAKPFVAHISPDMMRLLKKEADDGDRGAKMYLSVARGIKPYLGEKD